MKIPLLTLLFFGALLPLTQGQIIQYTYEDDEEQNIWFEEEMRFIVDSIGELTIADVLADSSLVFVDPKQVEMPDTIYYLWTNVELSNQSKVFRNEFFGTIWDIDSMWTYTTVGDQVTNLQITGEGVSIWDKHSPSVYNTTPLSLLPGETKTFWLRFRVRLPSTKRYIRLNRLFSVASIAPINKFIIVPIVWSFFYLGFMVLFCLLSFYMYSLFRDRIFLYFGGLMLSFGCFFMIIHRVSDTFLIDYFPHQRYLFLYSAISGIVFCFSLFVVNYLDLWQRYRSYVRIAFIYIILMEAFAHLAPLFISREVLGHYHNLMLLFWIVLCFFVIGMAAWRKEPKGKILFRMALILILASGIHILQLTKTGLLGSFFNIFQLSTIIFAAVLFYDLFTRIDTIRREKDRFQELDQLKSRFFANISHEFRTPLTLIMGPLNQLKEKQPDPEDRKLMGLMHRNAERLLNLINQILDLSKLEAGKMKLDLQQVNFPALLKGIVMSFESFAEQQGVRLHFASEVDELTLAVDPAKMEQIFNNLLSNAFKFTKVSEEVSVLLTVKEEWVTVLVKDTGRGIPADQLPHIFNRFFQADEAKTEDVPGTGIGLTLVKELVHLHGGTIDVRSIENKRTSFRLRFPVVSNPAGEQKEEEIFMRTSSSTFTFPDKELVPATDHQLPFLPLDRHSSSTPLVLIIEDHEDVRFYIKQNLRQHYRLLEAADGQDGIDKALEYQPDLIISDVMMPKKNGYEVCRTLKNDQRTSHIPLILLTAKAAREEKLHGLDEGADDYLLKPFDTEELQLRVRNLIASRQQLRQQFTEPAEQAVIDPQMNATDRAFLEQVYAVLDTHLDNEQFSVDVLAEEIGMSRRHLNRKLSALTDLSANPFIRNYRLQKALLMLERQEGNVSEVALATGFSSTAYFVKCFREKFGQTPGSL
ncbi:ATP-binding protein [Lewinella sp. LCG006]|uniref:ATP-binding protein n=1 Tax=Lewinella sp. LCG006 TaxID=3231911 RepID=UPI00345F2C2D